jgi:uncharacterized protein YdeI (YjbR/CyaY-like superfamily)
VATSFGRTYVEFATPSSPATLALYGRRAHAAEPRVVVEPADFARALDADPVARTAYDRLSYSRRREHVLAIESAKKAETRRRLIEKVLAMLRDQESAGGRAARAKRGDRPIGP